MNVFDLSAKITMDINGYLKGMDTAKAVAVSTMGIIGGEVSKFMQDSVNVGAGFDTAMSQVAATMGGTMNSLANEVGSVDTAFGEFSGNLREYAQFMGQNTAKSATECAEALNYMALAGYDAQTSMEMLPNVLSLSSAGAMDLARASDMVTDTQTAFGISLNRTSQMVDEMAKAASTGNTSVEQLGDAFLTVGGLAKELNGGMVTLADGTQAEVDGVQELEIALTAMANAGVKGSEAGTHMRNMLLKLSSPTKEGADQMKNLGVNIFDAYGNMRSLKDIMGDLNDSMRSLTQEQRVQAIADLFNTRDMASAEALLAAIGQDWDKIGESILNAEGSAHQMEDVQLDNLEGDITLFNSALEGMQIALSDSATPALREMTQLGTELIGAFTDAFLSLPEPIQTTIGMLGLVGGKVMEITPNVIGMASQFSILAQNSETFGGILDGILGAAPTLGVVGAAIGAIVAAVVGYNEIGKMQAERLREINEEVSAVADAYNTAKDSVYDLAAGGATAADAQEKLIQAKENLKVLRESDIDFTKQEEEAEKEYFNTIQNGYIDMAPGAQQYYEIVKNIQMATGGMTQAGKEYAETMDTINSTQEANVYTLQAAENEVYKYTLLSSNMNELEAAKTEALLDNISLSENSAENYAAFTEEIGKLNVAHQEEIARIQEVKEAAEEGLADAQQAYESYVQGMSSTLESLFGVFNTVKVEQEKTTAEMIEEFNTGLDSQIEYLETYGKNLEWLMSQNVDEGLVQKLSDGSTESAQILQALVDDGGAHIQELNSKFSQVQKGKEEFIGQVDEMVFGFKANLDTMVKAVEDAEAQMDLADETYIDGINTLAGYIKGAEQMRGQIWDEFASLARTGQAAWRSVNKQSSPSREFARIGEYDIQGAIKGAESQRRNLELAYGGLASSALDAYESEMHDASFVEPSSDFSTSSPEAMAAMIPQVQTQQAGATYLVLDGQIIGRVLNPYITAEQQRIGVEIA